MERVFLRNLFNYHAQAPRGQRLHLLQHRSSLRCRFGTVDLLESRLSTSHELVSWTLKEREGDRRGLYAF